MRTLWLFSLAWTAISGVVLAGFLREPRIQWAGVAWACAFLSIGLGFWIWLARQWAQRSRLGRASLGASPAHPGESVVLRLQLERQDLGDRLVTFRLEFQQPDDSGWTTVETLERVTPLAAGMPMVSATIALPAGAQPSRARPRPRRWLASARVQGLHLAPVECELDVKPLPESALASDQAISLDAETGSTWTAASPSLAAPAHARESSPGVWQWQERSTPLFVLGLFMLAFASFWLWTTARGLLPDLLAVQQGRSWFSLGSLLFRLPFAVAGCGVALIGLALLSFRQLASARPNSLDLRLHALGRIWLHEQLTVADLLYLQATGSLRSNDKILRYGLSAKTGRGSFSIPISAKSINELEQQARWLAHTLGADGLNFDPQVRDDAPMERAGASGAPVPPQLLNLLQAGRWFKQLLFAATALAMLGLVLMLLGTWLLR